MKNLFAIIFSVLVIHAYGQQTEPVDLSKGGYEFKDASGDTLNQIERMKAQRVRSENALRRLKNGGAIIIRLKTNDKSVEAYRQAGKEAIANRMVQERKVMNQKIYDGFSSIVTFCPVYFIYAKDTRDVLAGKPGLFLNANLEYDEKIVLKDTFFVVAEQGSASTNAYVLEASTPTTYVANRSYDKKFMGTEDVNGYTSGPASEAAIVFLDKALVQYYDPFPFCEGVYLENYNVAANAINKQFFRAYNRLVAMPDMRREIRKAKKDSKARIKEVLQNGQH